MQSQFGNGCPRLAAPWNGRGGPVSEVTVESRIDDVRIPPVLEAVATLWGRIPAQFACGGGHGHWPPRIGIRGAPLSQVRLAAARRVLGSKASRDCKRPKARRARLEALEGVDSMAEVGYAQASKASVGAERRRKPSWWRFASTCDSPLIWALRCPDTSRSRCLDGGPSDGADERPNRSVSLLINCRLFRNGQKL